MADTIGTGKYILEYEADTSKAKKALADLKTQLHDLYVTADTSSKPIGINKELEEAINAARQLHGILENSTTSTGKLDLTDFTQGLKQSGRSLEEYNTLLNKLGPTGTAAMQNVTQEILKADTKVNILSGSLKKFFDGLKNTAMWTIQSKAVHAVESAISGAYSYAQKLNGSLNDIRIVTGYSADKMADFAKQANKAAKSLSTTTNEYVKGSLIFYQQGLGDEVVKQRTDTTIKLANTSGESAEDISSYMTSIWNNFDDGSKSVEYYADALSYLGAASAATNADIAEGLQYFASTASTVGLSYEYAAGALTTLVDVTQQSASTIGNSLKTIFARLESVSLGETLDDDVTLTKYTNALNNIGVSVLDTNGNLRDMDDILDDMAEKWETLSNSQQVAVAQTVGGVRQYNNLISLMENYDKFKGFVSGASDSEGYLQQQADIYEESWAAASDRVEAAWESLYTQIIDDKTLITITNIIEKIVTGISDIMKGMGGLKGALPAIFLLIQRVYKEGNTFATQLQKTMDLVNKIVNQNSLGRENKETQSQALGVRQSNIQTGIDTRQTALIWDVQQSFAQYRDKYSQLNPGERVEYADIMDRIYHQLSEASKISAKISKKTQEVMTKEGELGLSYIEGNQLQTEIAQQQNASIIAKRIQSSTNHWAAAKDELNTINASSKQVPLSKEFKTLLTEIVNGSKGNGGAYKKLYNIPEKEAKAIEEEMAALAKNIKDSFIKNIKENLTNENGKIKKETSEKDALVKAAEMKEQIANLDDEAQQKMTKLVDEYVTINGLTNEQVQKQMQVNAELKKSAIYAQEQKEKREQQYQQITNALNMVSAISQGLSAMDGLVDSIKEGDVSIASVVGSLGSLWMAIKMIKATAKEFAAESALAGKIVGASWGWLVVGLAAAYVALLGIKALVDWFIAQTPEAKLEAAAEVTESCKTAANDAATAYSNLITTLDDLDGVYSKLNNLTKGTAEWTQAVSDANEQAQELIDTYDLAYGDYFFDDNGVIQFSKGAEEKMKNEAQQKANESKNAYLAAQQYEANLKQTQANNSYSSKKALSLMSAGNKELGIDYTDMSNTQSYMDSKIYENYNKVEEVIKNALKEGKISFSSEGWQDILQELDVSQDVINLLDSNSTLRDSLTSLTEATMENTTALQAENLEGIYKEMQGDKKWEALSTDEKEYVSNYYSKRISELTDEYLKNVEVPNKNSSEYNEKLGEYAEAAGWNQDEASGKWVDSNGNDAELSDINIDQYKMWVARNQALEQAYSELHAGTKYNEAIQEGKNAKRYSLDELNEKANRTQFDYGDDGLDSQELANYQQYLQENSENLKDNADMAKRVAQANMQFNVGLADIIDNYETYTKALDKNNSSTAEYVEALGDVRKAYSQMLDISGEDLSEEFLTSTENLNLMKEAANGNLDAITQLRENAAKMVINEVELPEDASDSLKAQYQALIDQVENSEEFEDLEIGASLDDTAFVDTLNAMLANGTMTIEEIQKVLNSLGFEPTIKYDYVPFNSETHATQSVYTVDDKGNKIKTTSTASIEEGTMVYIPKINSKKTTYRGSPKAITSSANKAGASGGSSKSTKNKSDEIERYHVIKEKLEDINEELDRISEAKDRAFGKSKIALMEQEVAEYDELIAKQKEYIAEIQSYYNSDAATMKGYGANIENGIITNYDALVGKYVDMYNAGSIDDDAYEAFKDALSNFEESSDLLSEQTDELIKLQNEKIDKLLAIVDEKVNLQLELNNDEMEYFDFLLETVADDAADAAEAIGLLGKKVSDLLENNEAYVQGIKDTLGVYGVTAQEAQGVLDGTADVNALVEKYGIDAQGVEQLKEYRDGLMDVAKELISLREEVYAKLNEVLDEFNEKMDNQINKIEQAQALMDHYKNIIDIVGKDKLGISDGVLKRMSDITVSNATGSLSIARQKKEENLKALQEAQAAYQDVLETGSEEDIKLMEEQLEELEDKVADATESWASSFESAIQVIQEAFADAIQAAADKFDETMAGTYGNLEDLQDAYDKQKSLDDLTLDTYEKIYQLNKLNRDITNSIDDTDNIAGKQQLLELQKEINDAQASTTEMTQYEVDFLQKKYDLYLAQIALEETQNAKNQVRMNRDNEGNWSYIYTADASATADAQQSYEDKLYELEKLNQDYIDTMQEQLLTSFAQYKEEIAALNLTDEERAALLEEYWNTLTEKYELYLNGALEDASWITDQVIGLDHELIDSYDETYLAKFTDTTSMMELDEEFKQASQQMISEVNAAYTEFENNTEMVMDAAGTSTTNFASTVEENMNSTVQKTEEAKNAASELQNEYSTAFSNAANSVSSFAQNYAKQMQTVITNTATSVDSINSLIKAIANLEGTTANTVSAVYGKVTTAANNAIASGQAQANALSNNASSGTKISRHSSGSSGIIQTSPGSIQTYNGQRYAQSHYGDTNWYLVSQMTSPYGGAYQYAPGTEYYTNEEWKKLKSLATGGYTGEWGNSGRLAVLHQKELVLNADDTSNFLSAIEMVRDITKSIDLQAQSQGVGLGALSAAGIPSSSAFEQNVNIQASFPNATNHSEIEEAFNNLINRASQFAGRK